MKHDCDASTSKPNENFGDAQSDPFCINTNGYKTLNLS